MRASAMAVRVPRDTTVPVHVSRPDATVAGRRKRADRSSDVWPVPGARAQTVAGSSGSRV